MISYLTSKTFWTVVLMFLIGGFGAVSSSLGSFATPILGILGIAATFFHISAVNNAAVLGSTQGRNIQY